MSSKNSFNIKPTREHCIPYIVRKLSEYKDIWFTPGQFTHKVGCQLGNCKIVAKFIHFGIWTVCIAPLSLSLSLSPPPSPSPLSLSLSLLSSPSLSLPPPLSLSLSLSLSLPLTSRPFHHV